MVEHKSKHLFKSEYKEFLGDTDYKLKLAFGELLISENVFWLWFFFFVFLFLRIDRRVNGFIFVMVSIFSFMLVVVFGSYIDYRFL